MDLIIHFATAPLFAYATKNVKGWAMLKCVYCGKKIAEEQAVMAKIHTNEFETCSKDCRAMTESYVAEDKKYKRILFVALLVAAILVVIAVFSRNMLFGYFAQFLVGIAFALFPYPVINFITFRTHSIRPTKAITRIVGVLLVNWSIILWQFA